MKKVISIILAVVLMMSLGVLAFADNVGEMGSYDAAVTGTYATLTSGTGGTVYSVDIAWSDLSFTYVPATVKDWNPDTHSYEGETHDAYWQGEGKITLTNHSNATIKATPSFAASEGFDEVSMTFGISYYALLGSAEPMEGASVGQAQSVSIPVIPGGTLPEGTEDKTIGNVSVKLEEYVKDATDGDVESIEAELTGLEVSDREGYINIVDSADSVASGEKYVLRSEFNAVQEAAEAFRDAATQAEKNLAYAQARAKLAELAVRTKP